MKKIKINEDQKFILVILAIMNCTSLTAIVICSFLGIKNGDSKREILFNLLPTIFTTLFTNVILLRLNKSK